MAGILSFTLGLEVQGFLQKLGLAHGEVLGLASVGEALKASMEGVWAAIERGGALNDLSNRTGESVRNLYQLQEAFKSVGVSTDTVAPMILRLQKAMSGVDEMGQRTDKIFSALGLDMDMLKKLDAPQQMERIAGALNKLDKNQASNIASQLFGKEGAGNILQISRAAEGFRQSFKDSAASADVFSRTASVFHTIGDTIGTIKMKIGGFFAGVAEGAAPAIQAVLDFVNSIDFTKVGQTIGTFLTAMTQAFREGKLGQVIGETLKLGFDSILIYAPVIFEELGSLLLKALETPLVYIQAAMEYALTEGAHRFANNPIFRAIITAISPGASLVLGSIGDTGGGDWKKILEERKKEGFKFDLGSGEFGFEEMQEDANRRVKEANEAFGKRWGEFWAGIVDFAGRAPAAAGAPNGPNKSNDLAGLLQGQTRMNLSGIEKLGFVFGSGTSTSDYARSTADSARALLAEAREHTKLLAKFADNKTALVNR